MSSTEKPSLKPLYRSYIIGFILSLVITAAAFSVAAAQVKSGTHDTGLIAGILVAFAIIQLVIQLLYFFHLGSEAKPRLNTVSFLFMLMVVGIIAFGSIWIMNHLNYNMPHDVDGYVQNEENIHMEDGGAPASNSSPTGF